MLDRAEHPLSVTPVTGGAASPGNGLAEDAGDWRGHASWRPAVPGPGFYRVRAEIVGGSTRCSGRLTLAVVESLGQRLAGEFGWSLPQGDRPLPLSALAELIDQAGVRWVKYPVWYGRSASETRVEELIGFSERLSAAGIELVGMLSQPPPEIRDRFGNAKTLEAADVFLAEPGAWYPSLEPVLMRLANRLQWWQLGRDGDTSFVGCPGLQERLRRVKTQMDRVGQDVALGIGSKGVDAIPAADGQGPCLGFVTLLSESPLTDEEWTAYLNRPASTPQGPRPPAESEVRRWVTLRPLPREGHAADARATDLIERMMAAKIHGADAIFASDPFDPGCGLLNPDGTPGELFLVWRTTALALGPGRHVGGVELPGGSSNEVFARSADAVMVVRNAQACEETLDLGDGARQIDAWGREMPLRKEGHRQVIAVGPVPTFVVGLSEPMARWRKDFSFGEKALPSVPGRPHANTFRLTNSFPVEAKVRAELVLPEGWQVSPARSSFTLPPGGQHQQPFAVTLPYDFTDGAFPVRVDFDVQADRPYRFSVYRQMEVGLGDVKIE
ncbi:MAG: hypothetical protein NTW96_16605, partial [Planctomycetia bacterium]|nr:hypothetical protein [Planctomycetia bacterium]